MLQGDEDETTIFIMRAIGFIFSQTRVEMVDE